MNFTGTWAVGESPDFDDEYLRMERAPYITLCQSGDWVSGEYHVGLQLGDLLCSQPRYVAFRQRPLLPLRVYPVRTPHN